MIKRTSREHVLKILKENQNNWNILDIGCNIGAIEYAQTCADILDVSSFYNNKKFILIKTKELPFNDNEFDFVFASHVIEHVDDVAFFIKELQRISKKGYIELPTMLEDNIVLSENSSKDHKWFFQFDDVNSILLAEKRKQLIQPFITHGVLFGSWRKNFKSSLVLELFWENEINYQFKKISIDEKKIYFISIIRKYLSFLIRNNKIASIFLTIILAYFLINFLF